MTKNDIIETHDRIILNIVPIDKLKSNSLQLTEFDKHKGIETFTGKYNNDDKKNTIQAYYFDNNIWDVKGALEWYNNGFVNKLENINNINLIDNNVSGYELVFDELEYQAYAEKLIKYYNDVWDLEYTMDDFPFAQEGTVNELANNYNRETYEAPLLVQHDRTNTYNGMAMGWISSLKAVGKKLYAKLDYTPEGLSLVKNQYYKYKSVGLDFLQNVGKYMYELSLTNQPALANLGAIKLSRNMNGINKDMYICTLSNDLRLNYDINGGLNMAQNSDNTLLSEIESLKEKLSSLENDVKSKDLLIEQLRADKMATEKQARLSHVTNKVENWIETGKIIPAVYEQFGTKEAYIEKLSNMNAENFDILDKTYSASEPNPLLTLTLPNNKPLVRTEETALNKTDELHHKIVAIANKLSLNPNDPEDYKKASEVYISSKAGGNL